jgi:signal-transduction protein with cAMP-binding, CBS, and nucleotidyltransferase domain
MPHRPIIKVIQNRDFIVASTGTSARKAAELMRRQQQDALVAVDASGRLAGICTEADLCHKILAAGLPAEQTTIGEIMVRDPLTIGPEKPFGHALHLMFEGGFRHMPVVDLNHRPIGIISARDALGLEILHFRDELTLREEIAQIL